MTSAPKDPTCHPDALHPIDPTEAGRLRSFVEAPWFEADRIAKLAKIFLAYIEQGARLDEVLPALEAERLIELQAHLTASKGTNKGFFDAGWLGHSLLDMAGRLEDVLRIEDESVLLGYLEVYPEDLIMAHQELEDRMITMARLAAANMVCSIESPPRDLPRILDVVRIRGGYYYLFPLVRVALRDRRILAFFETESGYELLSPTEAIDGKITENPAEAVRFALTRDVERHLFDLIKLGGASLPSHYESKPGPGRPKGSGGLEQDDRPFVELGLELIASGKARSPTAAAIKIVDEHFSKIAGGGGCESKVARLAKRIKVASETGKAADR